MAAIRYRQLQAPTLLDDVQDNGGTAAAQSLSNAFKSFSNQALDVVGDLRAQQGQREGAAAGVSGQPNFREGSKALTAYGEAYNNSALRSYAIHSETDLEDQAARLEVQANNDPESFRVTFAAVRDAHLKAAPAMAVPTLQEMYDRRMSEGVRRLSTARTVEVRNQQRKDTSEGIDRQTDRIANLEAEDNPANEKRIAEERAKLDLLIDGARNTGTITATEANAARVDASRRITSQAITSRFRNELKKPGGDPVKFIERLKEANKKSDVLPPDEEEKLVTGLLGELREQNFLDAQGRAQDNEEERARYEAGDREATADMLGGTLTQKKILDMVEDKRLKPETARTLNNELTNGDAGKSDPETLYRLETNLLDYTDEEIEQQYGLSWADKSRLTLKKREWESGWRGTQEGREAAERIDRSLGIPPGGLNQLLPDPIRKARERALTDWYNSVDSLEPGVRQSQLIPKAEEVIGRVIRQNKQLELDNLKRRRDRVTQKIAAEQPSGQAKKDIDAELQSLDAQIRQREQQVK
jgi:hypothetical protein